MKENKFKNTSDKDLEVIIKAQSHRDDYLEAMKEYVARQGDEKKKTKRHRNITLCLQILGLIFTLTLMYFAIGVQFYDLPVPFVRSAKPKPNTTIERPKPNQDESQRQKMNQKITEPHKTPKDEPMKIPSQQVAPPDRQKPGVR